MSDDESNLTLCKTCRIIKIRKLDGRYPSKRDKRWMDDAGKLWVGRLCPSCHAEKMKLHNRNKRLKSVPK